VGGWKFGGTLKRTITFFIGAKPVCWQKGTFVEIPFNNKTATGHAVKLKCGNVENTFFFKTWEDLQEMVDIREAKAVEPGPETGLL
jgi:hypothetical protein